MKRLAGTVNDTVGAAVGSGAVVGDSAAAEVTPSSADAATEPAGSWTLSNEWGVIPSGACQLRAPVESCIRSSALDPGVSLGAEIVTGPVAAVE